MDNVAKLIAQLVPNPDNHMLTESGFCRDRVVMRDPLSPDQGEQMRMDARLPSRPDILFRMISAAGTEPDGKSLLERATDPDLTFTKGESKRVKRLRAGKRVIGGIHGEEPVERLVDVKDKIVHRFWWEVNGTKDKVLAPHLVFEMDTGYSDNGPIHSSLPDDAAVLPWDTIASSFRLRPPSTRTAARIMPSPGPTNP